MKRFLITTAIIFCITIFSNAQDYNTGIGLRGGLSSGVTVKHFVGEKSAIEGIVSARWKGFNIVALYEIHNQAFDVEGLNWYYGFGGHVGFWDGANVGWADDTNSYTVAGLDGIIGLEYNFNDIPLNVSIDWKPAFNIIGYSGFWGDGGAFSIRYIF